MGGGAGIASIGSCGGGGDTGGATGGMIGGDGAGVAAAAEASIRIRGGGRATGDATGGGGAGGAVGASVRIRGGGSGLGVAGTSAGLSSAGLCGASIRIRGGGRAGAALAGTPPALDAVSLDPGPGVLAPGAGAGSFRASVRTLGSAATAGLDDRPASSVTIPMDPWCRKSQLCQRGAASGSRGAAVVGGGVGRHGLLPGAPHGGLSPRSAGTSYGIDVWREPRDPCVGILGRARDGTRVSWTRRGLVVGWWGRLRPWPCR